MWSYGDIDDFLLPLLQQQYWYIRFNAAETRYYAIDDVLARA